MCWCMKNLYFFWVTSETNLLVFFFTGEHNANHVLSDLEFEHETFANCNLDLKLKEEYGT